MELKFLEQVKNSHEAVTVFLTNGVKLQGKLAHYNATCLFLKRDGVTQLLYKHSVSTIMPSIAIEIDA